MGALQEKYPEAENAFQNVGPLNLCRLTYKQFEQSTSDH